MNILHTTGRYHKPCTAVFVDNTRQLRLYEDNSVDVAIFNYYNGTHHWSQTIAVGDYNDWQIYDTVHEGLKILENAGYPIPQTLNFYKEE